MKRQWLRSAIALALAVGMMAGTAGPAPTTASAASAGMSVMVDGNALVMPKPPFVENGRLLVPLRAISESLGAEVSYDPATKTVKVTKETNTYLLPIGSTTVQLNGVPVTIDAAPTLSHGTTYVPVRFLAEHLGASVAYDAATRTVSIATGQGPSFQVLAPAAGEVLYTDQVRVAVAVFGHRLADFRTQTQPTPGEGHVHIWLDTDPADPTQAYKLISGEPIVFDKLSPGEHTLTVQLVGNDHKPLIPDMKQVIRFHTAKKPGLSVTGPKEGEAVIGDAVTVQFNVTDFTLTDFRTHTAPAAGEGHLHVWLDSNVNDPKVAIKQVKNGPLALTGVKPGNHTLTVQLVGNDHKPIQPAVKQVIHFSTRVPSLPAAPKPPAPKTPQPPAKPSQPPAKPPVNPPAQAKTYTVSLKDFAFQQQSLTVEAGAKVTFTNLDTAIHTVTAKDGSFDSGNMAQNQTFTHTFAKPGVYELYCKPHPFMTMTVTVK